MRKIIVLGMACWMVAATGMVHAAGGPKRVPEGRLFISSCPDGTTDSERGYQCDELDEGVLGTGVGRESQEVPPEIFILDGSGDGKDAVTENGINELGTMVWAPGEERFAISGGYDEESCRLYVVDADTGTAHPVTPDQELACGMATDWSPDGRWIVMSAFFHDGPTQLYKVRPNGEDLTALTDYDIEGQGAWGAHFIRGGRILFRAEPDIGAPRRSGIFVMDPNGKRIQTVVQVKSSEGNWNHISAMALTADHEHLAYGVTSDGPDRRATGEVIVMDLVSGYRHRVSTSSWDTVYLGWTGDSRYLATFGVDRTEDGVREALGIIDTATKSSVVVPMPDGAEVKDAVPAWSPSGRYLAFQARQSGSSAVFAFDRVRGRIGQLTRYARTSALLGWY